MTQEHEYATEIFCGTLWEAQLLQSLLQNADVESYLVNALMNAYAFNPVISQSVKVMISSNDIEMAKIVMDDYFANRQENNELE
jgi:hypothetical protein